MRYPFSLQWHITTECQNRCAHCYMFDPATYEREKSGILSLEKKLEALDKLEAFGEKYGFQFPTLALMGGDPLLAPDWFEFASELSARGKTVSFGGNPETLTDENLARLKKLNARSYQLSLDGMEKSHDAQRSAGSFARTVDGIKRLSDAGIEPHVMTTLTPLNIDDFWRLADFVFYETPARSFAFDFATRVGNGRGMQTCMTPETALALSVEYLDMKEKRKMERPDFRYAEKPGEFRVLHMARGDVIPYDTAETAHSAGCLIGGSCIDILSDGTILSCRRFPELIGKLPEDEPEDILLKNDTLKRYRRPQFWKDCGSCIGWNWCRGCPAVSFGECGDPFVKPSICYARLLPIDTYARHTLVSMDTTPEQEAQLIKRGMRFTYAQALKNHALNPDIPKACLALMTDDAQRARFNEAPEAWLAKRYPDLTDADKGQLICRYNSFILD